MAHAAAAFQLLLLEGAGLAAAADDGGDSDAELADIIAAARHAEPKFEQRGCLLTRHMRGVKKALNTSAVVKVAPHVERRIEYHNMNLAIRASDIIDVSEKKEPIVRGKGKYRHWLPAALQRVCWGLKPLRIRIRVRGKRPHVAAPSSASLRTWAGMCHAGTTYTQSIRNAVAERFLELQQGHLIVGVWPFPTSCFRIYGYFWSILGAAPQFNC
jgi:hypothetical protein